MRGRRVSRATHIDMVELAGEFLGSPAFGRSTDDRPRESGRRTRRRFGSNAPRTRPHRGRGRLRRSAAGPAVRRPATSPRALGCLPRRGDTAAEVVPERLDGRPRDVARSTAPTGDAGRECREHRQLPAEREGVRPAGRHEDDARREQDDMEQRRCRSAAGGATTMRDEVARAAAAGAS